MNDFDRFLWEPEEGRDYGDEQPDLSPCCGGGVRDFHCKRYCLVCSSLIENCNGD